MQPGPSGPLRWDEDTFNNLVVDDDLLYGELGLTPEEVGRQARRVKHHVAQERKAAYTKGLGTVETQRVWV